MTLDDFRQIPYMDGGRTVFGLDCWGMARMALVELFGKPLLPAYGEIPANSKASLTRSWSTESEKHPVVAPRPGSLAAAWRGRLCLHFGLVVSVDGRSMILETREETGPQLTSIRRFEARYTKVVYHAN